MLNKTRSRFFTENRRFLCQINDLTKKLISRKFLYAIAWHSAVPCGNYGILMQKFRESNFLLKNFIINWFDLKNVHKSEFIVFNTLCVFWNFPHCVWYKVNELISRNIFQVKAKFWHFYAVKYLRKNAFRAASALIRDFEKLYQRHQMWWLTFFH